MSDMENLINELARDGAVKTQSPWRIFGMWVLVTVVYMALVLAFYLHPRADLRIKFSEPLFIAEIITLAALALSAIFSAAVLSFPDLCQRRRTVFLPPVMFGIFVAALFLAWHADVPTTPAPPHALECLICITLLSVAPALMLFYKIRQMAPVHPAQAGSTAALAAFAIGALVLRLSEDTNSMTHLVTWHYAPMLIFAYAGTWLGRKIFHW